MKAKYLVLWYISVFQHQTLAHHHCVHLLNTKNKTANKMMHKTNDVD